MAFTLLRTAFGLGGPAATRQTGFIARALYVLGLVGALLWLLVIGGPVILGHLGPSPEERAWRQQKAEAESALRVAGWQAAAETFTGSPLPQNWYEFPERYPREAAHKAQAAKTKLALLGDEPLGIPRSQAIIFFGCGSFGATPSGQESGS